MYRTCRHIKPNGLRCESPALRSGNFCYYHSKTHIIGADPNEKFGALQLPTPEDSSAIQLSIARISDAIINGRIDQKKATSLLYGLQIAAQFINRKEYVYPPNAVQSADQDAHGDELPRPTPLSVMTTSIAKTVLTPKSVRAARFPKTTKKTMTKRTRAANKPKRLNP